MVIVLEDLFGFNPKSILVFGIGGGGDVVSATMIAFGLRRVGVETYIGSIAWERFVVDPEPGPIPFNCFREARFIGDYIVVVDRDSYVVRSSVFTPQVSRVSKVVGREVYVVDLWRGVNGLWRGLSELTDLLGVEAYMAVDVGGDVLATGLEDDLWSPLADSMCLAAFSKLDHSILVVHGIGCDGELDPDYLLSRIAYIARSGGYLTARGLTRYEAVLLEKLLEEAVSEASRIPLIAYRGYYGELLLRSGSRKTLVTPLQTIMFYLDTRVVYKLSPLAKLVDNTHSLEEANNKLNNKGVYTEYDLEKDLVDYRGREVDAETLQRIRLSGISRLRKLDK